MKQDQIVRFKSEDGKSLILCDADTSLGALHDFLMAVKGNVVERISEAQKQEKEAAEKVAKEALEKKEEKAVEPEKIEEAKVEVPKETK